jgi:hypothetical protein
MRGALGLAIFHKMAGIPLTMVRLCRVKFGRKSIVSGASKARIPDFTEPWTAER